jgi:hypothetical protein
MNPQLGAVLGVLLPKFVVGGGGWKRKAGVKGGVHARMPREDAADAHDVLRRTRFPGCSSRHRRLAICGIALSKKKALYGTLLD